MSERMVWAVTERSTPSWSDVLDRYVSGETFHLPPRGERIPCGGDCDAHGIRCSTDVIAVPGPHVKVAWSKVCPRCKEVPRG